MGKILAWLTFEPYNLANVGHKEVNDREKGTREPGLLSGLAFTLPGTLIDLLLPLWTLCSYWNQCLWALTWTEV